MGAILLVVAGRAAGLREGEMQIQNMGQSMEEPVARHQRIQREHMGKEENGSNVARTKRHRTLTCDAIVLGNPSEVKVLSRPFKSNKSQRNFANA